MLNLILTLLLILVLAAAFWRFPKAALPALVFLLPFERIGAFAATSSGHPLVRPSQAAGAALILAWGLHWLKKRPQLKPVPGWVYLLGFAVSTGVAAAGINYPSVWVGWVTLLFYLVLFLVISQTMEEKQVPFVFGALFSSAIIVSLFGLYQFLGDIAGLAPTWTGLLSAYSKTVLGFPRAQSVAWEPLFFANYLLFPLLVGMSLFLARKNNRIWQNYSLIALIGVAFVLTLSRGAFVAALAGVGVLIIGWLSRVKNPRAALEVAGLLVMAILVGGGLIGLASYRANHSFLQGLKGLVSWNANLTNSPSFLERSAQNKVGKALIHDHQPFGLGLNGIGPRLSNYPRPDTTEFVALNNEALELLIQTGFVGYLLFAGFLIALLGTAWLRLGSADTGKGPVLGLMAVIIATLIQAQTFSGFFLTHRWVELGLLAGLLANKRGRS